MQYVLFYKGLSAKRSCILKILIQDFHCYENLFKIFLKNCKNIYIFSFCSSLRQSLQKRYKNRFLNSFTVKI